MSTSNGSKTVEECAVCVAGDLGERVKKTSGTDRYSDKVQVFHFEQFMCPCSDSIDTDATKEEQGSFNLKRYMDHIKPLLDAETNYSDTQSHDDDHDNDDDEDTWDELCTSSEDIREQTLLKLHEIFLPIVTQILINQDRYRFYSSGLHKFLKDNAGSHDLSSSIRIKKYAKPNLRNTNTHYANYLHNDVWITQDDFHETGKVAMVNVWFLLNESPPNNTLVFLETLASNTIPSHMLHASPAQIQDQTVLYDKNMKWGSFYLFVAGQLDTCERVLLHGAMDLTEPQKQEEDVSAATCPMNLATTHVRRSVEMRYTVHIGT